MRKITKNSAPQRIKINDRNTIYSVYVHIFALYIVYIMLSLLLHVKIFMWIFQVNEYAQKVIYLMYIREKDNCETLQQIPI